jgi:hypothetical protein
MPAEKANAAAKEAARPKSSKQRRGTVAQMATIDYSNLADVLDSWDQLCLRLNLEEEIAKARRHKFFDEYIEIIKPPDEEILEKLKKQKKRMSPQFFRRAVKLSFGAPEMEPAVESLEWLRWLVANKSVTEHAQFETAVLDTSSPRKLWSGDNDDGSMGTAALNELWEDVVSDINDLRRSSRRGPLGSSCGGLVPEEAEAQADLLQIKGLAIPGKLGLCVYLSHRCQETQEG